MIPVHNQPDFQKKIIIRKSEEVSENHSNIKTSQANRSMLTFPLTFPPIKSTASTWCRLCLRDTFMDDLKRLQIYCQRKTMRNVSQRQHDFSKSCTKDNCDTPTAVALTTPIEHTLSRDPLEDSGSKVEGTRASSVLRMGSRQS